LPSERGYREWRQKSAPRSFLPGSFQVWPIGGARSRNHKKMAVEHTDLLDGRPSHRAMLSAHFLDRQPLYALNGDYGRFHRVASVFFSAKSFLADTLIGNGQSHCPDVSYAMHTDLLV
jgi:hypothetical protein